MARDIEITGIQNTIRNLNRTISTVDNATMRAIMTVGLDLKGKAQRRAPVDLGTLRESGQTTPIKNGVEVSFGGRASAYALIQHENLSFRHPQGGEAKYLERPLQENLNKYIKIIKKGINEVTR